MDLQLAGKTALVTGASRGIGRAIALGLAREGVKLAIAARRVPLLDELARQIVSSGGAKPLVLEADFYTEGSAEILAQAAEKALSRVDILITPRVEAGRIPSRQPGSNGQRACSSTSSACASCRMRWCPA